MFYIPFLQAAGAAPSASATGSLIGSFLPIVLIFVVFYFFLIRPQNKKQKETQKMLDALKKGDKIITIGGIHGTISSVHEKTVIVKVDDNTKIEFSRNAIASVIVDKVEKEAKSAKDDKKADKTEETPVAKASTEASAEENK